MTSERNYIAAIFGVGDRVGAVVILLLGALLVLLGVRIVGNGDLAVLVGSVFLLAGAALLLIGGLAWRSRSRD